MEVQRAYGGTYAGYRRSTSAVRPDAEAPATYSIGQLAALTGLPVKTIRFYSDEAILPPGRPARSDRWRASTPPLTSGWWTP